MKIRIPLYAQHLNQAEFTQLITSSVDTLKQYSSSTNDPMVTDLIKQLEESLPLLKKSLKQKRGSDMTSNLNKALKNRKADYSAFVNGLKLLKILGHLRNYKPITDYKNSSNYTKIQGLPICKNHLL